MMRKTFCHGIRLLVLAIPVFVLAGCRRGEHQGGAVSAAGGPEQGVPLLIVQGPGGSTLALAPVFINGQGPFAFALDTGASHSALDQELADQLGLPKAGPAVEVSGVAATSEAGQVRVSGWRVGDVPLPGDTAVTLDLSETNRRIKLRGLLGSDVLSRFGAVTVDYDRQRLLLRTRPQHVRPGRASARPAGGGGGPRAGVWAARPGAAWAAAAWYLPLHEPPRAWGALGPDRGKERG